jgi:hypothetical protein
MGNSKFKRNGKSLKENMKGMNLWQRIGYLWFCFKDYTIVGIVCIILICAAVSGAIRANTEILLYGDLISVPLSEAGESYINEEYGKLLGVEKNVREISVAFHDYGISDDADVVEFNYQTTMAIVGAAGAKALDYIITSKGVMEALMQEYMYLDLREIMTDEELAAWGEDIVYVEYVFAEGTPEETVERIPIALNLQKTEFYKNCIYSTQPFFLMFIKVTPRKEACRHFMDYLLAYEPPKEIESGE